MGGLLAVTASTCCPELGPSFAGPFAPFFGQPAYPLLCSCLAQVDLPSQALMLAPLLSISFPLPLPCPPRLSNTQSAALFALLTVLHYAPHPQLNVREAVMMMVFGNAADKMVEDFVAQLQSQLDGYCVDKEDLWAVMPIVR